MAAGLAPLGLVGIGVLPGDLRPLLSSKKPFRTPADFAGASLAISKSAVSDLTFRVLGATTRAIAIGGGASIDGFDAVEVPIEGISGNGYDKVGRFVTANVRLWPRPIVVFMSMDTFAKLTAEQQTLLRNAVRKAIPGTLERVKTVEKEAVVVSCRNGVQFGEASDQDRAALRAAVEPVYVELEREPLTKRLIDGILQMKSAITPVDQDITCGPGPSQSPGASEVTAVDGVWEACPTELDILAAGGEPGEAKENAGCTTLTFHRGAFREIGASAATNQPGTYLVSSDRITIERSNGEVFDFTWSVFRDALTFQQSPVPGAISPSPWLARPFRRTGN
jgi:hypothetical protein